MKPITSVENLGKRYRIGRREAAYATIRESLTRTMKSPLVYIQRLLRRDQRRSIESEGHVWALKGIRFDLTPGELVGVIGRNGAGKSTLLKILSRVTEPTEGSVSLWGRAASLLEVGTGFHPELTGRENVFLSGAILGMTHREIQLNFDAIVSFAEVDQFIDTPVKHYSSGMQMRLAFAVAAHLESEILIVDEVLAVGDAAFQQKCINTMEKVGQDGRTVLFVSHSMASVTRLCSRAILLDRGSIVADGRSHEVASQYLQGGMGIASASEWFDPASAPGDDVVRLYAVRVRTEDGEIVDTADVRRPVGIEIEYEVMKQGNILVPYFEFLNEYGILAFATLDNDESWQTTPRPLGRFQSTAWIPGNMLAEGILRVRAAICNMNPFKVHVDQFCAVSFHLIDSLDGDSARGIYAGSFPGVVRPKLKWTTDYSMRSS
jgi:lipopolysaccharide transport system ATP-binding protein